jgi:hypothetical protein
MVWASGWGTLRMAVETRIWTWRAEDPPRTCCMREPLVRWWGAARVHREPLRARTSGFMRVGAPGPGIPRSIACTSGPVPGPHLRIGEPFQVPTPA